MKTILPPLKLGAVLLLLLFATSACQDTYEDLFHDPERVTDAEIKYLFTQRMLDANFPLGYWEGWYTTYQDLASWTHITGMVNGENMMQPNVPRWADLWSAYYTSQGARTQEMWDLYHTLPAEEQEQAHGYLVLAGVVDAYNASIVTDLWGDIPYTQAFQVRDGGTIFPAFDAQEVVYDALLDSLAQFSQALSGSGFSAPPSMGRQDIFLHGDVMAWARLANSLRLRMAMRMAEVAPDKAQQVVGEVLGGGLPLVETNDENIFFDMTSEHDAYGDRGRGFRERTFGANSVFAPDVMLNAVTEADDPRLEVLFDPNLEGDYVGLPYAPADQPNDPTREQFAIPDSVMFGENRMFPGVVMTAAEVSFLKAEAYLRGWADGDAQAAYEEGLRQSVEMFYDIYNLNPDASMAHPDPAAVEAFVTSSSAAFDGTIDQIAMQRYIHFNHTQPYQAWSSMRRTGVPELPPAQLETGRTLDLTVRLVYPSTEVVNNTEYANVQEQDTPVHRVWWDVD